MSTSATDAFGVQSLDGRSPVLFAAQTQAGQAAADNTDSGSAPSADAGSDANAASTFLPVASTSALTLRRLKPLALLDASPYLPGFTNFYRLGASQPLTVSLPTFIRLSNGTIHGVADVPFDSVLVKTKGAGAQELDDLVVALKQLLVARWLNYAASVFDARSQAESLADTEKVMSLIFNSGTHEARRAGRGRGGAGRKGCFFTVWAGLGWAGLGWAVLALRCAVPFSPECARPR